VQLVDDTAFKELLKENVRIHAVEHVWLHVPSDVVLAVDELVVGERFVTKSGNEAAPRQSFFMQLNSVLAHLVT
jgi:hypothetical protein